MATAGLRASGAKGAQHAVDSKQASSTQYRKQYGMNTLGVRADVSE